MFQSNKFRRYYVGKTRITWRCTVKQCKAMVHTVDGEVKDTQVTHSHDDTVKDVQAHLLRERCKSQTSLTSRPEAVICKELAKLPDTSSIDKREVFELAYQTTLEPAVNACPELMPFSEEVTTTYVSSCGQDSP